MNTTSMIGSMFALGLIFGTPTLTLAHVGHGPGSFKPKAGLTEFPSTQKPIPSSGPVGLPCKCAFDGSSRVLVHSKRLSRCVGETVSLCLVW
ncbi:cation efflux system protein NrsB, fragment [Limnospira platensis NIES-39]|uniref:Cation efflux system protein NrsB n=1 Tax=Limnospira platensis NIES-46 TaxID=1236695 RepID=A0A5M3T2L7_LIMPL|nr:cation efflux system protein NrsB, fragment [Arthrospira platensis NIES-39]BDT11995.1 cation efflux system protein NrsB, fragment [Arthrospira platensis NIES-39]GCE92685.1 cation efflux system protein NrsB, fragment [Arthrospira platensis NIES-46]